MFSVKKEVILNRVSVFLSQLLWSRRAFFQFLLQLQLGQITNFESSTRAGHQTDGVRSFLIHSKEIHKTYILYGPYLIEIMVF